PPLRRDAVRKLLCDDPSLITWLHPGEDGAFTPETLPDNAFRPLTDWVDYVLDHETQPLQAWVQAAQFDFEQFICSEDPAPPKPKQAAGEKDRERGRGRKGREEAGDEELVEFATPQKKQAQVEIEEAPVELPKAEPNVLEKQLRELEEKFLGLEGNID